MNSVHRGALSREGELTAKRLAARAALAMLPERGIIGLGSGSTASVFIEEFARLVSAGRELRGVATSAASRQLAEQLGVEVLPDAGPWQIDVTVDGADEVSPELDLIKGGGGCQTREKIVNAASRQNVILIDESKLSSRLGERRPVPIEVLPFGHRATAQRLNQYGEAALRVAAASGGAEPFRTESGNFIYDLATGPIADPETLDQALHRLPGVVETGLFLGRADIVIVGAPAGVRLLRLSG